MLYIHREINVLVSDINGYNYYHKHTNWIGLNNSPVLNLLYNLQFINIFFCLHNILHMSISSDCMLTDLRPKEYLIVENFNLAILSVSRPNIAYDTC